jgi:UDP-glucose 4-epimerase
MNTILLRGKKVKILVTGSSGTIGTRLCEKLIELKLDVVGVDKVSNIWDTGVNDITIVGDLNNLSTFRDMPYDFDLVVHLAANARVHNLVVNPDLAKENIDILYNTLEFCRKNEIKNFIFASSREVYGNTIVKPSEEDVSIEGCESSYTASKIAGEALVNAYRECYNMNAIICRFSNVYGMYDSKDRIVPLWIGLAKENEDITVFGENKILDFTYIDDTVDGIIKSIKHIKSNRTINISYGEGVKLLDVAYFIRKQIGSSSKISIKPNRVGEILYYAGDISLAKSLLQYSPKMDIYNGLVKTISWYERNI